MFSYIIILLVCATLGRAGDPKIMAACAQESGITNLEEAIKSFMTTGQIPDESDQKPKCMFLCTAKKENMSDNAGNMDLSKTIAKFGPIYGSKMSDQEIKSQIESCAKRDESDPCERIYQFHKCHMKAFLAKA